MVDSTKNTWPEPAAGTAEAVKHRLNELFKEISDTTNRGLAEHADVSEQAVGKWRKTGKISREKMPIICSYFGMPSDCLLVSSDTNGVNESESQYNILEQQLVDKFRQLSKENKARALAMIKILVGK